MAETHDEIRARRRDLIVDRAITESVSRVPVVRAAMQGGIDDAEESLGGFYNEDGSYTGYWKVGTPVASAPIKPSRFPR